MEDGLNGQDQIEVNGKMVSLKVHTIEEFIQLMELMNTNKISFKHKEVFTRKFNDTLKWFHNAKAGKDLEGKLPPKYQIPTTSLLKAGKETNTEGLGIFKDQGECRKPNKYTEGLGTFEDQGEGMKLNKYTKRMGTFKDQGEGRKPNKYTEGLGTFDDQGEGRKPNKYTEGMGFYVGESSRQNMGSIMNKYEHMVSELSNDQGNEGSWIKRKLNNIRLKRLHDINNKIEILESQQENRNKEELKAKRLKKVRCYTCKENGHFVNNCPVWKKKGKAKIVEEEDKESVAENHKPTIGKLKPHEPYTQVYRERIMISGDYLVLGTEISFCDDFWYVNSTISKHMSPSKHLLYKMKECFFVEEHKSNFLYKHGFEVEIIGDKCNITHMFDPINGKKDNKSQSERIEDGLNGQVQIEVNGSVS
ncbi:ARID DNA-binding domain-containing protein [Tanacetum coccineum]